MTPSAEDTPSNVTCTFLPCSASMGTIYAENKDEDGFLYVAYSGENTFGQ